MLSPMMTVFVLVILWLIVVVPMVLRRGDERRQDRSVAGFGRAMRALGRRAHSAPVDTEVFVPGSADRLGRDRPDAHPVMPYRKPMPAAQEALMHPVDRAELSPARAQMMARRRRSLGTLVAGALFFTLLGLVRGGAVWVLSLLFVASLVGYLFFLRSQALRDRDRRADRLARAGRGVAASYDITAEPERLVPAGISSTSTVVAIDDDDIELQSMDTIDLTGIYEEAAEEVAPTGATHPAAERRAS